MPRVRFFSLLFCSLLAAAVPACAVDSGGDEAAAESDFTEGSAEARAILALVNDPRVTVAELDVDAGIAKPAAENIIARRDEAPIETLRELDAVPQVGPATIKKLFEYAKKKGLFGTGKVEVVFSPQPPASSHLARIVREIDMAQSSIDIAMYSYSDAKIAGALAAAVQRGVNVRFVFNEAGPDARLATLAARASSKTGKIEASGVDVRFVNKVMHHKFMIVDGPRDDLAKAKTAKLVTGSANWSNSAATRFDENTLFVSDSEELALRFQREFDTMWTHARDFVGRDPALPLALSSASITDASIPDGPNEHVLFTSQNFSVRDTTFSSTGANTVADALVAAIQGATTSIHVASGHLRSRPVAEALIAKKQQNPAMDVRVYLDGQEYIAASTHDRQLDDLDECLEQAGTSVARRRACTDKGFLFGYQIKADAGIDVRYKYYAYRWDHGYAPQMHHKYMVVDGSTLFTGSYNLSDNAEHGTFENMTVWKGGENAALVSAFEENFEQIWQTGRDEHRLESLLEKVENAPSIPIVFEPMALSHAEISDLKQKIRAACPKVDSAEYRQHAGSHLSCPR